MSQNPPQPVSSSWGMDSVLDQSKENGSELFEKIVLTHSPRPDGNEFPDNWQEVAKNGCIGLNLLRVGWGGQPRKPFASIFLPDAVLFTTMAAAQDELIKREKADPTKQYVIIAAQIPIEGNPGNLAKKLGTGPINPKTNVDLNKALDTDRGGDYNFATWFPKGDTGYWEYMNHAWGKPGHYKKGDCPKVIHSKVLPDLDGVITLYGVVQKRPFKVPKADK